MYKSILFKKLYTSGSFAIIKLQEINTIKYFVQFTKFIIF